MAESTTVRPIAEADEGFQRLIALLDEQRSAMIELDALSRERRERVDAGDGEGLLTLLARRQAVVARLAGAAEAGRRVREAWESGSPAAWRVREVRRRIDELIAAHDRLTRADAEDAARLAARREAMARELADLTTGQRALTAYGAPAEQGPRFQDTRG